MATIETDRPGTVQGEVRMLIDGELVEAASGKRFDNVNPATEEVLGEVADASADDMQRAIARRAAGVRRDRLVDQPRVPPEAACSSCRRRSRASRRSCAHELVAEVGCPIALTYGPQLDAPAERRV